MNENKKIFHMPIHIKKSYINKNWKKKKKKKKNIYIYINKVKKLVNETK